ncbi:hypothetical protein HMPREF1608_04099 [Escherichia coli 908525]|nr:hypothetical protein HMPREF9530_02222 [Escherichia coli MS 21-1]ESD66228.1 hypothetical protein HMPREF1608_04099 [Escherichia coli 908525]
MNQKVGQIVDEVRFVYAGCCVNALFCLQNHANSIYCINHVGLISVAHQAVFLFIISLRSD